MYFHSLNLAINVQGLQVAETVERARHHSSDFIVVEQAAHMSTEVYHLVIDNKQNGKSGEGRGKRVQDETRYQIEAEVSGSSEWRQHYSSNACSVVMFAGSVQPDGRRTLRDEQLTHAVPHDEHDNVPQTVDDGCEYHVRRFSELEEGGRWW